MQNGKHGKYNYNYNGNNLWPKAIVPKVEVEQFFARVLTYTCKVAMNNRGNDCVHNCVDFVNPRLVAVFQLVHCGVHCVVFGVGAFHVGPVLEVTREKTCHRHSCHAERCVVATLDNFVVAVAPHVGIENAHSVWFFQKLSFARCVLQN